MIVVIGILAAVTTVAYNGVNRSAVNSSRLVEFKQWVSMFDMYKIQHGEYPPVPRGTEVRPISYCLGKGFPQGSDGVPRCRDFQYACNQAASPSCTSFRESESVVLMNELDKIGRVSAARKVPIGGTVGPYVEYYAWHFSITGWFEGSGGDDCPEGSVFTWTDGSRVSCAVYIDFNQ